MSRVVATLTTLPDRYELLYKTLQSLHAQTVRLDAIYLTLPYRAKRLNQEYPELPEHISALCTVIRSDIDYGPITKLYGALTQESAPDTLILSTDDDVIHDPRLVETLLSHHNDHPHSAICGTGALIGHGVYKVSIHSSLSDFQWSNGISGFAIPQDGRNVDVALGVGGVLYTRGMFTEDYQSELFRTDASRVEFLNDDIVVSGYLAKHNVPRRCFVNIPTVQVQQAVRSDALSFDTFGMIKSVNAAVDTVKTRGFFPRFESVSSNECLLNRIIWLIILGILLLTVIVCIFLRSDIFAQLMLMSVVAVVFAGSVLLGSM